MKGIIEDIKSKIINYFPKLFSSIQGFPYLSLLVIGFFFFVFSLSVKSESLAKAFAATGTMSAVIWALYHQEIKQFLDRPKLQIDAIKLETPYFRPEKNSEFDIDYYIYIPLINNGRRSARNCTPIVSSIFKKNPDNKWEEVKNWIPLPLLWAADEREWEGVIIEGDGQKSNKKFGGVERNLVPNRPYFFHLGKFDVGEDLDQLCHFELTTFPRLPGQINIYPEGYFCFKVKIIAEEIDPLIKYFYLQWRWDCKPPMTTEPERIIWKIEDNPPKV